MLKLAKGAAHIHRSPSTMVANFQVISFNVPRSDLDVIFRRGAA